MELGSYMLIKPGMTVQGTDGDLGTVDQVVADERLDVFRGIVFSHGLFLPKKGFIAADHIISVHDNLVQVDYSKAEAEQLPPVMPESSSRKETTL